MATTGSSDYKSYLNQLEGTLDTYLVGKAPALPVGVKDFIVNVMPYLTVIFLILALPLLLGLIGLTAFTVPFAFVAGVGSGFTYMASIAVAIVTAVLEIIALPGLFKRQKKSWTLLYYVALIGGVSSILSLNLWGLVIGTGISLYILFQIKSYYK
ncbi:MAG: hypothetical protein WCV81_05810 [Microgenomates group bacterium]|jgi:hypothetical protein